MRIQSVTTQGSVSTGVRCVVVALLAGMVLPLPLSPGGSPLLTRGEVCALRDTVSTFSHQAQSLADKYLATKFTDKIVIKKLQKQSTIIPEFTQELRIKTPLVKDGAQNFVAFLQENEFKCRLSRVHLSMVRGSELNTTIETHPEVGGLEVVSFSDGVREVTGLVDAAQILIQRWLRRLGSHARGESVFISDIVLNPATDHIVIHRNYVILRDVAQFAAELLQEVEEGSSDLGVTCS